MSLFSFCGEKLKQETKIQAAWSRFCQQCKDGIKALVETGWTASSVEAHHEVMKDMVKSLSLCGHTAMEKETEPWIFLGWGITLPVHTLADYYEIPEYTTLVSVLLNGHKVDWMPWEKLILGHLYFFSEFN